MSNIKIGRYDHPSITVDYAGWIEPDDKSWIIFLGADGKPAVYYDQRDEHGGVVGIGYRLDAPILEAITEVVA